MAVKRHKTNQKNNFFFFVKLSKGEKHSYGVKNFLDLLFSRRSSLKVHRGVYWKSPKATFFFFFFFYFINSI